VGAEETKVCPPCLGKKEGKTNKRNGKKREKEMLNIGALLRVLGPHETGFYSFYLFLK